MYHVISSFATVLSMTRGRAASAAPNASPRTRAATQAAHWAGEGHRRPAQLGSVGGWVALERSQQNFVGKNHEKSTPLFERGWSFWEWRQSCEHLQFQLRSLNMHIERSMESDGWARLHDNHVQSHLLNALSW